jgi:hypothetical protein
MAGGYGKKYGKKNPKPQLSGINLGKDRKKAMKPVRIARTSGQKAMVRAGIAGPQMKLPKPKKKKNPSGGKTRKR